MIEREEYRRIRFARPANVSALFIPIMGLDKSAVPVIKRKKPIVNNKIILCREKNNNIRMLRIVRIVPIIAIFINTFLSEIEYSILAWLRIARVTFKLEM